MKLRWSAFTLAFISGVIAVPASADMSALYEVQSEDEFEQKLDMAMTIEINEAGDARLHISGKSDYFLIRDGEVYAISRGIDGPYAKKLNDLEAVIADAGQAGGISLDLVDQFTKIDLVEKGAVNVGKWKGRGYAERGSNRKVGPVDLIISDDEYLSPIGSAFARLVKGRFGTLRALSLTNLFGFGVYDPKVRELLASGTPLRLKGLELSEVSDAIVDPERFELPARVLSPDEIRRQHEPFEWAPTFDRQPRG